MDTLTPNPLSQNATQIIKDVRKDADAVKRIERTRREAHPDLAAEKEAFEEEERGARRAAAARARAEEKAAAKAAAADKKARSYDVLLDPDAMRTAEDMKATYASAADYEDDFM